MLPMVFKFAKKLIVSRKWLIVSILTFLFTIIPLPFTATPTYAAPCENPIREDDKLTDNWVTNEDGSPRYRINKPPPPIPANFIFRVDFSELSALFAPANSNYIEGDFQQTVHKTIDVTSLEPSEISQYNGALPKLANQAMLDRMREETVKYIISKPSLGEADDTFTDTNGQNPTTIPNLVDDYGIPNSEERGSDGWDNSWGPYWAKIPTAYSEFYEGEIIFKFVRGSTQLQQFYNGELCPIHLPRIIKFVMPDFFRATATTGQLNQVIVPWDAQSHHVNDLIIQEKDDGFLDQFRADGSVLGNILNTCAQFLKNNPLSNSLEDIISQIPKLFEPVSPIYAQEENICGLTLINPDISGRDPYCALDSSQLIPSDSCSDKVDPLKQNQGNPNVDCALIITIPGGWPAGTYYIWPVFRIPLIAEFWNDTAYSDESENRIGSQEFQLTGRPGLYNQGTPREIFEDDNENQELIDDLKALIDECQKLVDDGDLQEDRDDACTQMMNHAEFINSERFNLCMIETLQPGVGLEEAGITCSRKIIIDTIEFLELKQPADDENSEIDERVVGGIHCIGPEFFKNNAHMPLAGQEYYGFSNECEDQRDVTVSIGDSTPGGPTVNRPGYFQPTEDNCDGTYSLNNPLGNFGDPNCDFSENALIEYLEKLDPVYADIWECIAREESTFNPNAFNSASSSGEAFGMFQMGHAAYPEYGLDYQIADSNTEYDRGDVEWHQQVTNAINWNRTYIGNSFGYWETYINGTCKPSSL